MESTEAKAIDPEQSYLLSIVYSLFKNRSIGVLIELKIPELLCNSQKESLSIEEIAAKSGCKTSTQLYPMMRMLAQWGIGKELENKYFCKNKALELLRRDLGPSLGHVIDYHCSEEHYSALRSLGACVKQGKPAFVLEHGMDHFEYMYDLEKSYDSAKMFEGAREHKIGSDHRRREFAENYSSTMTFCTDLTIGNRMEVSKNLFNVFPWSTCNKLVDISGSLGCFLASILKLPDCEHIQGYVLELPEVVDEAKRKIQDLGVPAHRIEFVDHDFTKPCPRDLDIQADTVMIKNTLSMYAFDDKFMKKFLGNCRNIFSPKGGRLLIIDLVSPDDKDQNIGVNGVEMGTLSIHWLSISASHIPSKREWIEHVQEACKGMGYQLEQVYDTFNGGNMVFELSFKPNNL